LCCSTMMCATAIAWAQSVQSLPGTRPLTWQGDLSVRMMDGAHRFVERKIADSLRSRQRHWNREFSSRQAYERTVEPNRKRFREKIGVVDPRVPAVMERFGDDSNPALVADTAGYSVYQARWRVLEGVHGEGLLLEPKHPPAAQVVALPDADQTPEQISGLAPGLPPNSQFARRLAESGCRVIVPTLIDRTTRWAGHPEIRMTDQTDREWIYRQAFQMGRHVIGYEVQKVLAAVDWFKAKDPAIRIGAAGYGEGGLIAFYAAAADTRIDAALVSGYFNSRQAVWSEPIYRNVWGLLEECGDAELASLIAPRGLVVEYSKVPEVRNNKGDLITPPFNEVAAEFERIGTLTKPAFQQRKLVCGAGNIPLGPGSREALGDLLNLLGDHAGVVPPLAAPVDRRRAFDASERQGRQVRELEAHVQNLVRNSEHVRARFFLYKVAPELADDTWSTRLRHETRPAGPFIAASQWYRDYFWKEVMGKFEDPYLPPNPRSRKILETDKWAAYDVVLDVWQDVFAWGVLLMPKDLRPGERRPVVVCQHGRNGLPLDVIEKEGAYNQFAAKLADRGFIVFAPHNLYRGEDRYRWLSRKANSIKASLFSFIIGQHDQTLRWLQSLPFVDPDRVAFYGLSYGGETAVRVPAILKAYCLSICSGDFNNWTRKVAATDERFSFMYTIEWEMPYFNLGNTFDYAEMAYLIFPRPFMVERGHNDRVGRDRWVAYEYANVRWLYTQLGLRDRTEIEYFNGGHAINGEGTFEFLHKHLNWPAPQASRPAFGR
ncbi:MAG: dienelactone hydrolase family protein, partial [Acidobacteria bacterium]|nr:dienelactone hydrolase family protein [Acidobacteriota bacterium]